MDKNLKKIFVLLLFILVIIFIISNMIFKKEDDEIQKNSYVDEKNGISEENNNITYKPEIETKYSNIMQNKEKEAISKAIDSVVENLNNKNYKPIYDKLSEPVKNNLFPSYEDFERELSERTEKYTYSCDGYVANYYGYDCLFYPKDNYNVLEENNLDLAIRLINDGEDYIIIWGRLISYNDRQVYKYVGQVAVCLEKELKYIEKTGYVISFKNNSKSNITIDFNDVYGVTVKNGYEYQEHSKKVKSIQLKPQETKKIEFSFDSYKYLSSKPTWLNVSMKINGKNTNCEFYLYYEDYINISE